MSLRRRPGGHMLMCWWTLASRHTDTHRHRHRHRHRHTHIHTHTHTRTSTHRLDPLENIVSSTSVAVVCQFPLFGPLALFFFGLDASFPPLASDPLDPCGGCSFCRSSSSLSSSSSRSRLRSCQFEVGLKTHFKHICILV